MSSEPVHALSIKANLDASIASLTEWLRENSLEGSAHSIADERALVVALRLFDRAARRAGASGGSVSRGEPRYWRNVATASGQRARSAAGHACC
jgi:hypothetical protein